MLPNVERLRGLMEASGVDTLIALSPENVFYFCECSPVESIPYAFAAVMVPREGEAIVLWPKGESATLRTDTWIKDQRFFGTYYVDGSTGPDVEAHAPLEALSKILREAGFDRGTIGIEDNYMPVRVYDALRQALPKAAFVGASDILKETRLIKTEDEIARLRRAVTVSETALVNAYEAVGEGISELEIATVLRRSLADDSARDMFIEFGAGPRSWLRDPAPSEYRLTRGDSVHIDLGIWCDGYCSDISRNAVLGAPSDEQRKAAGAVLAGQQRALEAVRPGVEMREVFEIADRTVRESGFPNFSRHNMGHSIGLEVHEDPYITATTDRVLEPRMVISVEIPFHIAGVGGFNVEDIVLVTDDGYDYMSTLDRDLYIL